MPHIQRLAQLRRVVEDAPDDAFDLNYSDMCVLGHARRDPWFRDVARMRPMTFECGRSSMLNLTRIGRFFGIGAFNALRLLGATFAYPNPSKAEIIANIDRLIEGGRAVSYGRRPGLK